MEVRAEVQIQAARHSVWQKFLDISAWPDWHLQISAAEWLAGPAWSDGSVLWITVSPFLVPVAVTAQIKLVSPQNLVVWESRAAGLVAVHVFEFRDSLGGCLVQEKETYHGPSASFMSLLRGRQTRAFRRSLHNFKEWVEGNRAREA